MLQTIERKAISTAIRKDPVVLILFFNVDCIPCKIQKTVLKTVIRKRPDVKYYGISTEIGQGEVPRIQIFKDSVVVKKFTKVATRAEILEALDGED